jgi:hypothetical protein
LVLSVFLFGASRAGLRAVARPGLCADVDAGERMQNSENVQEPQDGGDYYDSIQNGLDGALHGYEVVDQPEQNTHYHQNDQYLK